MHALITGGAGFIGSHLAEYLLDAGHRVTVIDNLATGSLDNVRHLQENPGFELVLGDVLNDGVMERLVMKSDVVYHLAAAVGVRRIIDQPLLSLHTNIRATEIVLEQASRFQKPVLIASTSEVYGMVVPRFVKQALHGDPLTIYGDGQQTRCFTDVRDTVKAITRLMETKSAVGQTFNIGGSHEITIEQLARTVIQMTRSDSILRYVPYEQVYEQGFEDTRRRVPEVSKLRRTIGFAPSIPLEHALENIIDDCRAGLDRSLGSSHLLAPSS